MFGFLLPLPLLGGIGARTADRRADPVRAAADPPDDDHRHHRHRSSDSRRRRRARHDAASAALAGGDAPRHPEHRLWRAHRRCRAVGSATIAAAVGAGGLGEYIYRGLAMVDTTVILAGAIPAAALALLVDGALWWAQRRSTSRHRRRTLRAPIAAAAACGAVGLAAWGVLAWRASDVVVVGSKNFAEQLVLGEIVAQAIERDAGLRVERRLNLGGTLDLRSRAAHRRHRRLRRVHRHGADRRLQPAARDRRAARSRARCASCYARSGRTLLSPLGFDNTFAMLVRGADARARGLRTIDDAAREAPRWRAAFGYEFLTGRTATQAWPRRTASVSPRRRRRWTCR